LEDHGGHVSDTFVTCLAWRDIDRTKDLHFEINRRSLHRVAPL
jgi:hypothetical protein